MARAPPFFWYKALEVPMDSDDINATAPFNPPAAEQAAKQPAAPPPYSTEPLVYGDVKRILVDVFRGYPELTHEPLGATEDGYEYRVGPAKTPERTILVDHVPRVLMQEGEALVRIGIESLCYRIIQQAGAEEIPVEHPVGTEECCREINALTARFGMTWHWGWRAGTAEDRRRGIACFVLLTNSGVTKEMPVPADPVHDFSQDLRWFRWMAIRLIGNAILKEKDAKAAATQAASGYPQGPRRTAGGIYIP